MYKRDTSTLLFCLPTFILFKIIIQPSPILKETFFKTVFHFYRNDYYGESVKDEARCPRESSLAFDTPHKEDRSGYLSLATRERERAKAVREKGGGGVVRVN